jgi:predicted nucleotidyltransferase
MRIVERKLSEFFSSADRALAAVYLFGSEARGTAGPRSDVDVALLYAQDPPATLEGLSMSLEGMIEQFLGRPVQVVVLNHAPPDLIHRVLRDGKLVLDRDRSRRIQFEVRSRNRYFDIQPHLRRYRKSGAA